MQLTDDWQLKLLLSGIGLSIAMAGLAESPEQHLISESASCCATNEYYSGYIRHFKRSYFSSDDGGYYAVNYKDHTFRDEISKLLKEHDAKFDTICFRVAFCREIGENSGDLVNNNIILLRGIDIKQIDCPQ